MLTNSIILKVYRTSPICNISSENCFGYPSIERHLCILLSVLNNLASPWNKIILLSCIIMFKHLIIVEIQTRHCNFLHTDKNSNFFTTNVFYAPFPLSKM